MDARCIHLVSQEVHTGFQEIALGPIGMNTVLLQTTENLFQTNKVLLVILSGDDDVINLTCYAIDALQDRVHGPLEKGGS